MKILKKDFVFNEPIPTPECHASTILVLDNNKALAAWFGGTKENKVFITYTWKRKKIAYCECEL